MEVNLEFLLEIDQLVQLIESPAFVRKNNLYIYLFICLLSPTLFCLFAKYRLETATC